ncbi:MAG: hypothetical protein ACE5HQ_12665 [Gemmatimonadota bacterium]
MLSILLAFAIDAWWQDRVERREEIRLLSALRDEFLANQSRIDELVAFHSALKVTAETLLEIAANPPIDVAADSIDQLIGDVTWWGGFINLESATLDAVILGGKLDVIKNEDLRGLLTSWRQTVEATATQEGQEVVHFWEIWTPLLRPSSNMAQFSNTATTIPGDTQRFHGSQLPVAPPRVDHRVLLGERKVQNALVQKSWIEDDTLRQYRLLESKAVELIGALEREISR